MGLDKLKIYKEQKLLSNEGQIKVDFSVNEADPSHWHFSLPKQGTDVITDPPKPFVFSSVTDYPDNTPPVDRNQNAILIEGNGISSDTLEFDTWIENNINLQPHWWRIEVEYTRSDSATDEFIRCRLQNPFSNFRVEKFQPLERGNLTSHTTFDLKTYADSASLPSQGASGYNMIFASSADLDVTVLSVTRESIYKAHLQPF